MFQAPLLHGCTAVHVLLLQWDSRDADVAWTRRGEARRHVPIRARLAGCGWNPRWLRHPHRERSILRLPRKAPSIPAKRHPQDGGYWQSAFQSIVHCQSPGVHAKRSEAVDFRSTNGSRYRMQVHPLIAAESSRPSGILHVLETTLTIRDARMKP
ncbi:hypothetical protein EJ04DRAFT_520948 [Polyplosphaeria fusca]|uniref:Uncharacterized protein n=1 Tax=Polyplosphaeria fusca TaxID=682080 RepID=A0A9P4R6D4_9PLEO|nr:hypothetical protein EJ04DRAFT_520948 [Polyplosphaeria fusca]